MTRLIVLLSLALVSYRSYAQVFEGEIIYTNDFESKTPGLAKERLNLLIGTRQEYFIKGGKYKSITNGKVISMQLYDNITNSIYNKRPDSDTLYFFDASVNTDGVSGYEIERNADTVLGNICDAIILKTKAGTTTLYYSKKYMADSAFFKRHQYGNWAFFISKSQALPLKTILENGQFKMISVATEIKPMKLDSSFFNIDKGTPVKRNDL